METSLPSGENLTNEFDLHAMACIDRHGQQAGWIQKAISKTFAALMTHEKFQNVRMVGQVLFGPHPDDEWEVYGNIAFFGIPGNSVAYDQELAFYLFKELAKDALLPLVVNHNPGYVPIFPYGWTQSTSTWCDNS